MMSNEPVIQSDEIVEWSYGERHKFTIPYRDPNGHKGTFGKLLIIAGSSHMCGAAMLATESAFRCGAGMVRVATHKDNRTPILCKTPEAIIDTYPWDENMIPGEEELDSFFGPLFEWADGCLIGCGLGRNELSQTLMRYVLNNCDLPMTIDGDGLYYVAVDEITTRLLKGRDMNHTILTPHVGELSLLLGEDQETIRSSLAFFAKAAAEKYNQVIAAKSSVSYVAQADTEPVYRNSSGNNALAVAGSGDVLAGMVCALQFQYSQSYNAACAAIYLHGKAGDIGRNTMGERSLLPGDLFRFFPEIFQEQS